MTARFNLDYLRVVLGLHIGVLVTRKILQFLRLAVKRKRMMPAKTQHPNAWGVVFYRQPAVLYRGGGYFRHEFGKFTILGFAAKLADPSIIRPTGKHFALSVFWSGL